MDEPSMGGPIRGQKDIKPDTDDHFAGTDRLPIKSSPPADKTDILSESPVLLLKNKIGASVQFRKSRYNSIPFLSGREMSRRINE